MQIPVQDHVKEKFQKDLAELETLKQKAKTDKPKPVGSFLFQNLIVTIFLLFVLFLIGFLFSYYGAKKKYNLEIAKFTPQAQINIPASPGIKKCDIVNKSISDPSGTLFKACSQAKTQEVCENVDIYNEANSKFNEPDTKPDCIWKN